jgi:U3 small nucleolar RNA-associated protein 21
MPEVDGRVTKLLHLSTMMLVVTNSPPRLHTFDIPHQELIGSLDLDEGEDVTAILHPATWLNKIVLGRENGIVQIWNIRTRFAPHHQHNLTIENSSTRLNHLEVQ